MEVAKMTLKFRGAALVYSGISAEVQTRERAGGSWVVCNTGGPHHI